MERANYGVEHVRRVRVITNMHMPLPGCGLSCLHKSLFGGRLRVRFACVLLAALKLIHRVQDLKSCVLPSAIRGSQRDMITDH